MATIKHIASKNADYGAAEQYLTFEHDEFTGKPVRDAQGHLVPRLDYRIATLGCGYEDFAVACMRVNLSYGKNLRQEDVKSHHYIISFDPRDGPDNSLTVGRAQELDERFCAKHFPGHQAIALWRKWSCRSDLPVSNFLPSWREVGWRKTCAQVEYKFKVKAKVHGNKRLPS